MAKKLKRAFTIVELVIVIAVIAILAAVLIPTFTTLIDKANQSADTSNVKNMNSILAMDETTNGKPKTMDDAVKVIREGGYDLEKLTPTGQGYDIVWDQDANRLLMVNGNEVIFGETEKNANEKHLWVVVDSVEKIAATGYSVYLTDVFEGKVEAKQGVDVGSNEDITKVTYNTAEEQNVTIRTNGGALEVDAGLATVSHYDAAASVDIKKVADESYHEYGTVAGNITLKQGRFVAEDKSSAAAVIVTAETYSADNKTVEVVINDTTKTWSIAAENETVAGKLTEVVSGNTANAEIAVSPVMTGFAGGVGTESSPYLIANEEQFKNINSLKQENISKPYWFKLIDKLKLSEEDAIVLSQEEGVKGVIDNFDKVVFDGNDKTIELSGEHIYLFNRVVGTEIKNLNVVFQGTDCILAGYDRVYNTVFDTVTMNGELYFSDRNSGLFVAYAGTGSAAQVGNITFINCVNNANIYGEGEQTRYNAVFVGYAWGSLRLIFENCSNNGVLHCGKAALFVGNQSKAANHIDLEINNFVCNGNVFSFYQAENYQQNDFIASAVGSESTYSIKVDGIERSLYYDLSINVAQVAPSEETPEISYNSDKTFTLTDPADNIAIYRVTYATYVQWWALNSAGTQYEHRGTQIVYITEEISADQFVDGKYTTKIKWLNLATSGMREKGDVSELDGNETVTIDGVEYYLIKDSEQYRLNNQIPQIINENKQPVDKENIEEGYISASKDINIVGYDVNGHLMVGTYLKVTD